MGTDPGTNSIIPVVKLVASTRYDCSAAFMWRGGRTGDQYDGRSVTTKKTKNPTRSQDQTNVKEDKIRKTRELTSKPLSHHIPVTARNCQELVQHDGEPRDSRISISISISIPVSAPRYFHPSLKLIWMHGLSVSLSPSLCVCLPFWVCSLESTNNFSPATHGDVIS